MEKVIEFSTRKIIPDQGELKTITELVEISNMRTETLRQRIKRGMDIQKAIETPVRGNNKGYKPYPKKIARHCTK